MATSNTATTYGSVTKFFHWLTALLIIAAFPLGIIANDAPIENADAIAQKIWLFSLHKTIGVTAFFTALARILWAIGQKKPGLLDVDKPAEVFLAELIHWILYIAMLVVPLSGWMHHAATTGLAPILWPFGQSVPFISQSQTTAAFFSGLHFVFTKVLIVSILLHIAGALKHAVIDKDKTLARMLPFTKDLPTPPNQTHSKKPQLAAIAVFAAAAALGTFIGTTTQPTQTVTATQPQTDISTPSNWSVDQGTLSITVSQFGKDIIGEFTNWYAHIYFTPTQQGLQETAVGHVTVNIPITGLSLGSVTEQAMGLDYFSSEAHPTAVFDADIFAIIDGFEARGTLNLKGVEMPISLPFSLEITDKHADMHANLTLNRLDFNIGNNMPDESSLKFAVAIAITLSATRTD